MGSWRRGVGAVVGGGLTVAALGGCVEDVGTPPGFAHAEAIDVNADGLAAVTAGQNATSPYEALAGAAFTRDADGEWTVIESLGAGGTDQASAINDAGTVVGTSWEGPPEAGHAQAFVWDAEQGTRPLPGTEGMSFSTAVDISDSGLVAGVGPGADGNGAGFVHDLASGTTTPLAPPPDIISGTFTHLGSIPTAVNDDGVVVGFTLYPFLAYRRAVVWAPPAYEGVLLARRPDAEANEQQWPTAVDDDGTIVGRYFTPGQAESEHGAIWRPTAGRPLTVVDDFVPEDIDDGTMVGASPGGRPGALYWGAGEPGPEPLGRVEGGPSAALAIDGDHIVGSATVGPTGPRHAARFTPNP